MTGAYPLVVDLTGRPCLVVGGGRVGARKVSGLLAAGAKVTVVSPVVGFDLNPILQRGEARWVRREYLPGDLEGMELAFAATPDPTVNARVAEEGRGRRVWVNVADDPDGCDFHLPAVLRRGDLVVAVTTCGASPGLAAWARDRVSEVLPPATGQLVDVARQLREMALIDELRPLLEQGLLEDLDGCGDGVALEHLRDLLGATNRQPPRGESR